MLLKGEEASGGLLGKQDIRGDFRLRRKSVDAAASLRVIDFAFFF